MPRPVQVGPQTVWPNCVSRSDPGRGVLSLVDAGMRIRCGMSFARGLVARFDPYSPSTPGPCRSNPPESYADKPALDLRSLIRCGSSQWLVADYQLIPPGFRKSLVKTCTRSSSDCVLGSNFPCTKSRLGNWDWEPAHLRELAEKSEWLPQRARRGSPAPVIPYTQESSLGRPVGAHILSRPTP